MKNQIILVGVLTLFVLTVNGQITSKKFGRHASASISRISLFQNNGTVEPNVLWSQFDATKRSSLIAVLPDGQGKVKVRVLAENTPDAALEAVTKITNSLKNDKLEINSALEFSRNIVQIKRSSYVDNFRTISYRISELINNDGKIDPDIKDLLNELIKGAISTSANDNVVSNAENEVAKIRYQAELQKQKNITTVIETLNGQLKEAKDDESKKKILAQLTELLK